MMYILIRNYTVHFNLQINNLQITNELRKSISASLVNQQLTWGGAILDSNTTLFYHALITG